MVCKGQENRSARCDPYPDASGTGFLLPCNQRIESSSGEFIGVAGIDMSLDGVIDVIGKSNTFVLNEDFEIMLRSKDHGIRISSEEAIKDNKEKKRTKLESKMLRKEIERARPNGIIFDAESKRYFAYAQLRFAPWIIVQSIPHRDLFSVHIE